ncbi:MAG TPA: N,N-dimethylformamidase beta subunit family domain-containing protein [Gaiellaceae bacterium]|nr:N,N-dimethylformamidase beta subunit family domain-containing protein [Gaiellaceae bacterium]
MRKRIFAALAAALAVAATASAAAPPGPPRLLGLRVSNGGTPFAGDTPWLTTVSPNGDAFRDRALIRFALNRPATVELQIVATDEVRRPVQTIWSTRRQLGAGPHTIVWRPARGTPDRTYLVRLVVIGANGARRVYGYEPPRSGRLTSGVVVRVQGVDVGFLARSYPVGGVATAAISTDARRVKLQLFSFANVANPSVRDLRTGGVAVSPGVQLDWGRHGTSTRYVQISPAGIPSGLYFLRVTASDGRVGYAPLILRPRTLGEHRVAVVLSTNTWQAYNFLDANGDGWGDSWYVGGATPAVDLSRPFLDFGVPFRFRDWDLSFISWLSRTGKQVDFLSDDDLERVKTGDELRRAYRLVVFPGHEEYVSAHVYDVVRRYRDLGGDLMFLSANNFFWKITRSGHTIRRVAMWRKLGRPEAALVGTQWSASNYGTGQAPYVVAGAASTPWAFAGTGLRNGSSFGRYGIEIDSRAPSSPPGTRVLARVPNAIGKHDAEMTYYESGSGARVFAAGTLNFTASIADAAVSQLVQNVWTRLAR